VTDHQDILRSEGRNVYKESIRISAGFEMA
jgi:hypothetical protein